MSTQQPVSIPPSVPERPYNFRARLVNRLMVLFCYNAAILAMGLLLFIFCYIFTKGITAINWDFFSKLPQPPDEPAGGMRNGIAGTLVLIGMSSTVGIPIGMLCGIYLSEYAKDNWFANAVRLTVDILAGVPSIIVGVLGYEIMIHQLHFQYSAWAGSMALGFMMCPIIARTTEEILKLVPQAYREASVGVGASRFQTLVRVVLPAARGGIITGIMLAIARISGETAPLLFTASNSDQPVVLTSKSFPYFYLDVNNAFPSLTAQIFKCIQSPSENWKRQAWAGLLVLIVLVTVLNLAVRLATRNKMRK